MSPIARRTAGFVSVGTNALLRYGRNNITTLNALADSTLRGNAPQPRQRQHVQQDRPAAFTDAPDAFGARYGAALARVADPRTLPALAADFDFGLECFLDGVAVTIQRQG